MAVKAGRELSSELANPSFPAGGEKTDPAAQGRVNRAGRGIGRDRSRIDHARRGRSFCSRPLIVVPVFASSHVKEGRLLASTAQSEYLVNIVSVGGPLSSGGPEGDDEGLSLVTYWPNK